MLRTAFASLLFLAVLAAPAAADTWSSKAPVVALPGFGTASKTLVVDHAFKIRDLNVIVTLAHEDTSQLRVRLLSPSGTSATLIEAVPGTGFTHTVLDDESSTPLPSGSAPYTGSFLPTSPLSVFDDEPALGEWTLSVDDLAPHFEGTLRCFSLAFNGRTYVADDMPLQIPIVGQLWSYQLVPDSFAIADAEVTMTVQHTWPSDLRFTLVPPSTLGIELVGGVGGETPVGGYLGTTTDDQSTDFILPAFPFFLGRFPPPASSIGLGSLSGGSSWASFGFWRLEILDGDPSDEGVLHGWSLHLVPETTCAGEADASAYGAGLAGTLGVPALSSDDPVLGETLHLLVGNSSGAPAAALLVGGLAPAALPFKGGQVLVLPTFEFHFISMPPSLTLGAGLPEEPALCGQHLYLQVLQADAGAPAGVALSAGLDLLLGS